MSIVGKHINIYEYPDDQITSNNVIISWEFTHPDVQVDFYLEGIDPFYSEEFSQEESFIIELEQYGNYIFYIKSILEDEEEELIIPFSYVDDLGNYEKPPTVFPYQNESDSLLKAPISKIRPARFRGPAGSKEQNDSAKELYYDLNALFTAGRSIQESISDLNTKSSNITQVLLNKIENLSNKVEELKSLELSNETHYKTLMARNMKPGYPLMLDNNNNNLKAYIDVEYNLITPPLASLPSSKMYLYDPINEKTFMPEDLNIIVSNSEGKISENARVYAFNGRKDQSWIRQISYPANSSKTEESVILEVEIPKDISANFLVNTLAVTPYPEGGINIDSIELIDLNENTILVPGFPSEYNVLEKKHDPIPIKDASRTRFSFKDIATSKLRIKLTQKRFEIIENKKVFTLGITDFNPFYVDYDYSPSTFYSDLHIESSSIPYNIIDIEPQFLKSDTLNSQENEWFTYNVYTKEFDESLTLLNSLDNITYTDLVIVGHFFPNQENNQIPIIQGLKVNYKKS